MVLFGNKKGASKSCGCGNCASESIVQMSKSNDTIGIKVLGSGCPKCVALEASVLSALKELGMDAVVDHVTDFSQIAAYGVMSTPALVVDGKVVSYGKVLNQEEAKAVIQKARA